MITEKIVRFKREICKRGYYDIMTLLIINQRINLMNEEIKNDKFRSSCRL